MEVFSIFIFIHSIVTDHRTAGEEGEQIFLISTFVKNLYPGDYCRELITSGPNLTRESLVYEHKPLITNMLLKIRKTKLEVGFNALPRFDHLNSLKNTKKYKSRDPMKVLMTHLVKKYFLLFFNQFFLAVENRRIAIFEEF